MDSDGHQDQDISSLISTNRELIKTKRQKNMKRLEKYSDKVDHLNRLICLAKQGKQKDYLKSQLGKTLSKRQKLEQKIEQIDLIQQQIEKYGDKENDKTYSDNNLLDSFRLLLNLLEQLGISSNWISVQKKRLRIKYEGQNNINAFEDFIQDLVYIVRQSMEKIQTNTVIQKQSLQSKRQQERQQQTQLISSVNELLKVFQHDYFVQSQYELPQAIQIIKQKISKSASQHKSNIKKWNTQLQSKQKQYGFQQNKLIELKKLKKTIDKDIETNTKKLQKIQDNIERQNQNLQQKQFTLKKLIQQQSKFQQKQYKSLQNQQSKKQKLESQRQKLKNQISKQSVQLKSLQSNINQQLFFKQNKIKRLIESIAELKEQKSKLKLQNHELKQKVSRKQKQLVKLDQQYKNIEQQFYKSKDVVLNIKKEQQELRQKYQQFMVSVLDSKQQYQELINTINSLEDTLQISRKQYQAISIQKQEIETFVNTKTAELKQITKEIEQFTCHKVEMQQQFQEIEQRKQSIFATILEKQQFTHKLQENKNNLEHRINSLEHQSTKYTRLFKQYNETIQKITQKIQKLKLQQKAITSNIDELQEEERNTLTRIKKIRRTQMKEYLTNIAQNNTKAGITQILDKVDRYDQLQRRLKQEKAEVRRLRLQNENMKVLQT